MTLLTTRHSSFEHYFSPSLINAQDGLVVFFFSRIAKNKNSDYWDAAEELYEKLPILGSFMRWITRKLKA